MQDNGRFAIAELTGGLGNQLFQYAAARALSLRERRALSFAWHLHRGDTQRRYMLDAFQLGANVQRDLLKPYELWSLGLRSPLTNRKAGKLWRALRDRTSHLKEESFAYSPIASYTRGVVLEGYFQSYRYFEDAQAHIRDELRLVQSPAGRNAELLDAMAKQNPVCVHVRRGDYANNAATNAFHGLLGLAYYEAAFNTLGSALSGATFYVFSDDPAWAQQHLPTPGSTIFVAHNSVDEPWEDLRLMAACNHFVIANSSLSWWGAWLSAYPHKQVVAPLRWFAGQTTDTRDLCPPDWTRL